MAVVHGDEGVCWRCSYALAGVTEHERSDGRVWMLCVLCATTHLTDIAEPLAVTIGRIANAMVDAHGPGYRAEVERHLLGERDGSGTYTVSG